MKQQNSPKNTAKGIREAICPEHRLICPLSANFLTRGLENEIMNDSSDAFPMIIASWLFDGAFRFGQHFGNDSLAPGGDQCFVHPARLMLSNGRTRMGVPRAVEEIFPASGVACLVAEFQSGPTSLESRQLPLVCGEIGVAELVLINGRAQTSARKPGRQVEAVCDNDMAWLSSRTNIRKETVAARRMTWRKIENG